LHFLRFLAVSEGDVFRGLAVLSQTHKTQTTALWTILS